MSTDPAPAPGSLPVAVEIYDTTLRDGAQLEGISLTVDDKLRIAEQLDRLGVHYIEGGWPGSNPKDEEFFKRARTELDLTTSKLVAFGSTRRVKGRVDDDPTLANLVAAGTGVVCIVGKAWDYHVTEALRTTLEEGVAMVADSVRFLKDQGLKVFFDAEHFFDGYDANPEFSLAVLEGAAIAGADCLVLCDTNGGSLPARVEQTVRAVVAHLDTPVGVHLHNDTGCGVANALVGVAAGATQVQGTINGYGERVGNCDLVPIIANLSLKLGVETIPEDRLARLTSVAHHVAELVNFVADPQQPYVGTKAFAHKAGLHTSAIARRSDAYEHVAPELVGNGTHFVVSEMAGRSTIALKATELGLDLDAPTMGDIVETLKELEFAGYHFEAADASLELLMRAATGWEQDYFHLESFSVEVGHRSGSGSRAWNEVAVDVETEATVRLWIDGELVEATGEGNGPVNALDAALRQALDERHTSLRRLRLTDYKVRVLGTGQGTGAVTRVLIDSTNGERTWSTIGVSENIIEASWQALVDAVVYSLLHAAD
ncbi:MAG: citramalate synthase [Acidimicrobiales bacterium]|jgi:2-isopropylmalate synthase|nr:citramalate synthase [Actinomycetes bacterium]MDP6106521.1 citramalate synthase [Acidimicrobiales bacterium]MCP4845505.1 citramalate synthase [Actinomycetes bacterium]MDP6240955.1 citramalate synthase [Acidimicrobiales bacterium]MDP7125110.1 citramalate synthase [Acidimicrobiales bacterium]|tara:strand:- start:2702 stop:4330 length:1629 start_codon:yes stop_codon:yes gene_type:complete